MFGDTNRTWKNSRAALQKHVFLNWLRKVHGDFFTDNSSEKLTRKSRRKKKTTGKLVILEIGCGISLHSLRMEVELLLQSKPSEYEVNCIRINPKDFLIHEGNVGIGMCSLEVLEEIGRRLEIEVSSENPGHVVSEKEAETEEAEIDVIGIDDDKEETRYIVHKEALCCTSSLKQREGDSKQELVI